MATLGAATRVVDAGLAGNAKAALHADTNAAAAADTDTHAHAHAHAHAADTETLSPAMQLLVHRRAGAQAPRLPRFDRKEDERLHGRQRLAAAYRIFAFYGLNLGVGGHITYRDPLHTDHFWVNPLGIDFSLMTVSDLVLVRDDGTIVEGRHSMINGAGYAVHAALHKARPDVHAAAHSHAPAGTTYSALGQLLPPITQEACSFYQDHALYADYGGAAVGSEGERIARALGPHKAVICRNHGIFTVGATVDAAVFWFVRMERACEQMLRASAAGTPVVIDHETALLAARQIGTPDVGFFGLSPMIHKMFTEQPGLLD